MPTTNFDAVVRMADRCGASIPDWLRERFRGLEDEPETRTLIAGIVAAQQIEDLRDEGFDTFHFYTLNQGDVAVAICRLLGLGAPGAPRCRRHDAAPTAIAALHAGRRASGSSSSTARGGR